MLRLTACLMLAILTIGYAVAEGEKAGKFDYYVMALSWSPSWCALEGDRKNSRQCEPRYDYGFILHGLWPQYERGWPSFCPTAHRAPSRGMTAAMADIMGTAGLAWHQWDKHGRCTGLSAAQYYEVSRTAYASVERPEILRRLMKPVTLPATLIEEAFLKENPSLTADMMTVSCKRGHFHEVKICLNKDLSPRACGDGVVRDCKQKVLFPPVR